MFRATKVPPLRLHQAGGQEGAGLLPAAPESDLPEEIHAGEPLDCWRVETVEADRLLRLAAEMKLPGRAWLEFEITPDGPSKSTIRQTAIFDPLGLFGLSYWYAIYPLHEAVFGGMLRGIARSAEGAASEECIVGDKTDTHAGVN